MNILAGILFGFLIAFLVWQQFSEYKEKEKKRKEQEIENMKMASKAFVSSVLKAFKEDGQVSFCSAFKPNPNPNNLICLDANHIQWRSVLQGVTPTKTEYKDFEVFRNELNLLIPQIFATWQNDIPMLQANMLQLKAKWQKYIEKHPVQSQIEEMQVRSNYEICNQKYSKLERELVLKNFILQFQNAEITKIVRSKRDLVFEVRWA